MERLSGYAHAINIKQKEKRGKNMSVKTADIRNSYTPKNNRSNKQEEKERIYKWWESHKVPLLTKAKAIKKSGKGDTCASVGDREQGSNLRLVDGEVRRHWPTQTLILGPEVLCWLGFKGSNWGGGEHRAGPVQKFIMHGEWHYNLKWEPNNIILTAKHLN